ncbi:MAG: hypothetical protein ACI4AA_03025 [Lachnospiraceae bacterium]
METKEWQQFCKTGSIEDYLTYREAAANSVKEEQCKIQDGKGENTVGHAGFCNSDRDDFTGASHGRI